MLSFSRFWEHVLIAYLFAKDHSVWVQIPKGLKITEMTSSKSSFILTGFLWVKTPEKAWCPAVFTAGHLFQALIMVRVTGLEPVRQRHTPLKRACLPVPAHSHNKNQLPSYYTKNLFICQYIFQHTSYFSEGSQFSHREPSEKIGFTAYSLRKDAG